MLLLLWAPSAPGVPRPIIWDRPPTLWRGVVACLDGTRTRESAAVLGPVDVARRHRAEALVIRRDQAGNLLKPVAIIVGCCKLPLGSEAPLDGAIAHATRPHQPQCFLMTHAALPYFTGPPEACGAETGAEPEMARS